MATAAKPLTGWYPNFAADKNFEEVFGWDVVLREIFTVLVTRQGTRQWQPRFGCKILDRLFDSEVTENELNNDVKYAFTWLPYVELVSVNTRLVPMSNSKGKRAEISMRVSYNGEHKDVSIEIPPQMDILNGMIHQIRVRR